MAELKPLLDEYGIIHEALGKIPDNTLKMEFLEALAGLARLAMARGEPSQAMVHVHEILEHLKAHTLDGTYEPFRIYLTCYRVLGAAGDARANDLLESGIHRASDRPVGGRRDTVHRARDTCLITAPDSGVAMAGVGDGEPIPITGGNGQPPAP